MKQPPKQRPFKDERDEQIDTSSKSAALDFVITATQVLTVMCLIQGNPAWKGTISLAFFEAAFEILYKYKQYEENLYRIIGVLLLLVGIAFLVWLAITG